MSQLDCNAIYGGWTGWIPDDGSGSCGALEGTSTTTNGAAGGFTIDQVKTFASEPITSTWNISDSTVEQWFLQNDHNHAAKYSLNASNIGAITSAVRAAGVSPAFFYLDAKEEGTGAGGFINHYSSDVAGGGVANATHDAEYIASQSQITTGGPAAGGGEPSDMPTAEAKNIFDSLPKGSLGVYYIQATSAVTAELETLSGKTGDWSGKYNSPFEDLMKNIKTMGGDPSQGGANLSAGDCAGGVVGEGMAKGISFAQFIANNNGYGYDQDTRASGFQKWQSDPSCTHQCGSFDCSSFVSAILTVAGYFAKTPDFVTSNEATVLTDAGFKKIANSATSSKGLQPGDIMLWNGHTEMYIGNDQAAAAHIDEKGGTNSSQDGSQVGDQNGDEINIEPFERTLKTGDAWIGVYRAPN